MGLYADVGLTNGIQLTNKIWLCHIRFVRVKNVLSHTFIIL